MMVLTSMGQKSRGMELGISGSSPLTPSGTGLGGGVFLFFFSPQL